MADFTSTDFISDYTELLNLVQTLTTKWAPEYSDEADPGVVLLKLAALMKDKISYKQDMAEAQAYLDTVSDRQSAFELLQMLGYVMKNKKSSTGSIQILNSTDTDIALPAFSTVFSNADSSISFFLLPPDQNIKIGSVSSSCEVMEGSIFNIEKEGVDSYTIKDIDESGRFYLGKSGIAQNGVWIGIKNSDGTIDYVSWKNLDASVLYPTEKYFFILSTSTGENYIQFPSNYSELLSSQEFIIKATYSKGAAGNIKAGTLRVFSSTANESIKNITFTQLLDFTSGRDEESISQGIQNYYNSQSVFNTLVTSHDFTAALRSLKNFVITSTPTIFSNIICRSALDRQQKFIANSNNTSYTTYKTLNNPQIIDVLGLNGSTNYDESFKILKIDDVEIKPEIEKQLRSSTTIGTTFEDVSDQGYIQAEAIPSGVIIADIQNAAEAQEIQEKIIDNLKNAFKAQNETFGKKISFNEYVNVIQSSDSRILNVSLNDLSYQVKKIGLDGENLLNDESKLEIAAKSVIQGSVPLYKFTNRNNTLNLSILNPGYINQGLGMSDYKQLIGQDTFINPVVTVNSFEDIILNDSARILDTKSSGILSSLNILQFRKPIYTAEIEYGYGASVTFKHYLNEDIEITEATTLNQGSIIAAGSSILLDKTASQGLVEKYEFVKVPSEEDFQFWWLESLTKDYTVIESVQFAIQASGMYKSKLAKGSVITRGSTLNKTLDSGHQINDEQEYILKENESIEISTSSSQSVRYGAGDIIKPSKITLECGVTYILGSIQIVSKLAESKTVVNKEQKYFIVSNSSDGFIFKEKNNEWEYTIEDNEFFVYSNSDLSEYLILGTGTVLRTKKLDGDASSYILSNVQSSTTKNSPNQSAFKDLDRTITAYDYEISTFSEGYRVTTSDLARKTINIQYEPLHKNEIFTIYNQSSGEEYLKFKESDGYEVRLCILLSPDENGMISFKPLGTTASTSMQGISLTLKYNDSDVVKVGSISSDEYTHLLLGQITQCFITSESQLFLSNSSDKIQMAACNYLYVSNAIVPESLSPRSTEVKVEKGKSVKFYVPISEKPILARCKLGKGLTSVIPEFNDSSAIAKIINTSSNNDNLYLYLLPKANNLILSFKFEFAKTNTDDNVFEILDYSIISGYSDEIKYIESITGEQIQQTAPDYFSPEFNLEEKDGKLTGSIEAKIYTILGDEDSAKFDWLFTPSEEFSSPTNSSSYFNSAHPENYRTLPKLKLDFETVQKNLKILAVSGRKLK